MLKKWLTGYIFMVNEIVKLISDTTQISCYKNLSLYFFET